MVSSSTAVILSEIFSHPHSDAPRQVHIRGTSFTSQAYFLVLTLKHLHTQGRSLSPLVVLCPDEEQCVELYSSFETLTPLYFQDQVEALIFPSWEQSPYSAISPSIRTRFARLNVLSQLLSKKQNSHLVIFTTLTASFQTTLSPQSFNEFSISIRVKDTVPSLESLSTKLTHSGYQRVDLVEDPGSFSIRGDLIDVFPPDCKLPLRIISLGMKLKILEFLTLKLRELFHKQALMKILTPPLTLQWNVIFLLRGKCSSTLKQNSS